ncbi:MAG: GNAT family N-acetyltransferase [Bacteroidia bacterium]|nr:GNAT family N-acetyltransferase [Bacteroidia bacterium]
MEPIITQRLILREWIQEDAQQLYALNNDVEVLKYTGDLPFANLEAAETLIRQYDQYRKCGYGRWAVLDRNTGDFLGWCGLKYSTDKHETDVGFRFHKKHWNKGYATEATMASIKQGFQKYELQKIVGRAMNANLASINVLKKCGLQFERPFDFNGQAGSVYAIHQKI